METTSVVIAIDSVAKILEIFGLIVVASAFACFLWRTGSIHALRHKIWKIFYGDAKISNIKISEYLQERIDLMALRQDSGLRFRTVAQGQRVVQWLQDHDESGDDLKASEKFFDLDRLEFKVDHPKKLGVGRYRLGCLALLVVVLLGVFALTSDRVYFRMINSGRGFSASLRERGVRDVSLPWQRNIRIDETQCGGSAAPVSTGDFSAEEVATICQFLKNKDADLPKSLHMQRLSVGLFTAEALFFWLWLIPSMRRRHAASEMLGRVLERRARVEAA